MSPSFLWGEFSRLKRRATITLLMPNARYHQKRSPTHHKMTITIANTDSMPNHARIVIIDERNIFGHTKSNNTSNYAHTTPHHRYYTENAIFILNNACKVGNKHSNRYIDSYISQTHPSSQSPTNSDDTRKVKYSEKYCASNCEEHSRFGATHTNSQSLTKGYYAIFDHFFKETYHRTINICVSWIGKLIRRGNTHCEEYIYKN